MGSNQSKSKISPDLSPKSSQSESNASLSTSHQTHKNLAESFQRQKDDFFIFLENEERFPMCSPFFSKNGLSQDIIQVTGAEPDISLEAFYALYNILWPQIEEQGSVSLKDAWTRFIGDSIAKGSLCPPEKLITEKGAKDIKQILSRSDGEGHIFRDLDQVVNSISDLKQRVLDYPDQLIKKEEIITSLNLLQQFYLKFRNRVKTLVHTILEKERINASYSSEYDVLEDLLEPKAVLTSDIFPSHWAYRISRSQAQKLLSLDTHGRHTKSSLSDPSNHRVVALPENTNEPLVFFKANGNPPIQPEKEFMLYSLYKHLRIPVPETALLILTDVFEANSNYFYVVQASEAVIGESPLEAYQNSETVFDQEAFASQVMGALLTNPSDGVFKNFKYSPRYKTFISIDNDMVFEPELVNENIVNVKSMLYLMPQMDQAIPKSVKTFFLTLDPNLTILSWLQDLSQKNREYQLLFTRLNFQSTRCAYQNLLPSSEKISLATCLEQKINVESELHPEEPFYPQIVISTNLLTCLTKKLPTLEKIFLQNRSVSLQTLLEEVSPILGKYYQKLRLAFNDPELALEALGGKERDGINYSCISSVLGFEEFNSLSNNMMDQQNHHESIPEDFFKEYKDLLISGESPFDRFLRRQMERKMKGILNLQEVLKELRLLIQENLIDFQSSTDIVDFCYDLSNIKMAQSDQNLLQEIISIFSSLPHPELQWLLMLEKYFLRTENAVPNDLFSSSLSVNGSFMRKRTFALTEPQKKYLFDQQGNLQKNTSLTGRSRVTYFPAQNPDFYLKQYPEFPGYEFASTLFMRLLGIQHLPYNDLLIVNSKYPVLVTQKVHGQPVFRAWHDPQALSNLDPFHTGLLIISAMLLNPEDGKEDNFILSEDGKYLIPIDNDHCFLPSTFQKRRSFWNILKINALQTKTILFCLDEMNKPLPLEVMAYILSIDFDGLFTRWMIELVKVEDKFSNLVDQNQQNKFLEQGTVMRIPFDKQFIANLHWKVHKIQDLVKASFELTPFDLLKAIEPFAAKCYKSSFREGNTLQNRFREVTNQLYTKNEINGSRVSILNTQTILEIVNISEEELQKDATFQRMGPLDALELLKQFIEERSQRTKMEQGMLYELDEETLDMKWISLFGCQPKETFLKNFFLNPKEGLDLRGSKLITNSNLMELFGQTPNKGIGIRFLSIPESPLLTAQEIKVLAEECPNLEYLNVSGCVRLEQIFTAQGEWPLLSRLEAKNCLNLNKLVSYSPMKILRIETDKKIEIFVKEHILDIFEISAKANGLKLTLKKGKNFEIEFLGQTVLNDGLPLDVTREKEEIEKYFTNWKITIGQHSIYSLKDLATFNTPLNLDFASIQTEEMKNSEDFIQRAWSNFYHSGLSDNKQIIQLVASSSWSLLEHLNLEETGITAQEIHTLINKPKWPVLKHLSISCNPIENEGLQILASAKWPLLKFINLSSTKITSQGIEIIVQMSDWPNLKELDVSHNMIQNEGLEILALADWPFLERLNLSSTKIASQGIESLATKSKFLHLKELDVSWNSIQDEGLTVLSHAKWPLLESLYLQSTDLTEKGIERMISTSMWPNLKVLDLSDNSQILAGGFEVLTLGQWPLLERLSLKKVLIAMKDVETLLSRSSWPNLKEFHLTDCDRDGQLDSIKASFSTKWPKVKLALIPSSDQTSQIVNLSKENSKSEELKLFGTLEKYSRQANKFLLEDFLSSSVRVLGVLVKQRTIIFEESGKKYIFDQSCMVENKEDQSVSDIEDIETSLALRRCHERYKLLKEKVSKVLVRRGIPSKLRSGDRKMDIDFISLLKCYFDEVATLDFPRNKIGHEEAGKLVKQISWRHLFHFNVNCQRMRKKEFSFFLTDPSLLKLLPSNTSWYDLSWLRDKKRRALPPFPPLALRLQINTLAIDFEEAQSLSSVDSWRNLSTDIFYFDNTDSTEASVLVFKTTWARVLKLIFQVNASFSRISSEETTGLPPWTRPLLLDISLISLSEIPHVSGSSLTSLTQLDLSNSNIGNEGARVLAESQSLINLVELNLSENNIGDEGVHAFASSTCLNQLRYLNLSGNNISDSGMRAFETSSERGFASELNLNRSDADERRRIEPAINTSQINIIFCENNIVEDPARRDQQPLSSFEHAELGQEVSNELIKKAGSIFDKESSSCFNLATHFHNNPEKSIH